MAVSRRKFIARSAQLIAAAWLPSAPSWNNGSIMTVRGPLRSDLLGFALTHEHILVDMVGADRIKPGRYDPEKVFGIAVRKLNEVKASGCNAFFDCTPAWLGRDVKLLARLSAASGLQLVTNTGYYGAAGEKFLPPHAFAESSSRLAERWIAEWEHGIDGTPIRPGFVKSGVDGYPLTPTQRKLIDAAAITHLSTGLTIGVHTGDGKAALEELDILRARSVSPSAWVWIHAQNEKDRSVHYRVAKAGGWVSYDGVNENSLEDCISFLHDMRAQRLLHRVLVSQDSGWYHVEQINGGEYAGYICIRQQLLPLLTKNGFTEKEVRQLFIINPAQAFMIRVRKS